MYRILMVNAFSFPWAIGMRTMDCSTWNGHRFSIVILPFWRDSFCFLCHWWRFTGNVSPQKMHDNRNQMKWNDKAVLWFGWNGRWTLNTNRQLMSEIFQLFLFAQNVTLAVEEVGIIIFGAIFRYGGRILVQHDDIWSSNHDNTRLYHMVFTDDSPVSIVSSGGRNFFLIKLNSNAFLPISLQMWNGRRTKYHKTRRPYQYIEFLFSNGHCTVRCVEFICGIGWPDGVCIVEIGQRSSNPEYESIHVLGTATACQWRCIPYGRC